MAIATEVVTSVSLSGSTNYQGFAVNDNATKAMLPALAALVIGKAEMDPVNQQVSLMLIVPFVLFGPLAGWLSDRFSKRKVTSGALFAQVVGLAILCLGMGLE